MREYLVMERATTWPADAERAYPDDRYVRQTVQDELTRGSDFNP